MSLKATLGHLAETSREYRDTPIAIAVDADQREASAARESLVSRDTDEEASREGLEAVLKKHIYANKTGFDGLAVFSAGFMSELHSKTQTSSGAIDSLTDESVDQGLMDGSYQDSRRKAGLPAPILVLR